jgi:hypothetical protein
MTQDYKDKLKAKKSAETDAKRHAEQVSSSATAGDKVAETVEKSGESVTDAINKLNLTTFLANKETWASTVTDMASLAEKVHALVSEWESRGVKQLDDTLKSRVSDLDNVLKKIQNIKVESDKDAVQAVSKLTQAISELDVKPVVNLPAPNVTVNERSIDFAPLLDTLKAIELSLGNQPQIELSDELKAIEKAVRDLIKKPSPGFAAPYQFLDTNGGIGPLTLVESTSTAGVQAVPVVNPDGSDISGGGGSGVAAYSDSGGTDRKGLVDADRHVQTDVLSSALPTGAATSANQQTDALTNTQLRATPVPVSGTVTANLGTLNGAATSAKQDDIITAIGAIPGGGTQYTEGDIDATPTGNAIMWRNGSDALISVTTTDPLPVVQTGTVDVNIASEAVGLATELTLNGVKTDTAVLATTIGQAGGASTGDLQRVGGTDGTFDRTFLTDTSGRLVANINSLPAVTGTVTANAGTNLNTSTLALEAGGNLAAAATSLAVIDDWDNAASNGASISGDIAHDSADDGEPAKIGFRAYSPDGTTPGTAVAENDRTNAKGDLDGRMFMNDEHPRWWSYHVDGSGALTDASVQADPGDGFQIVITDIIFSNGAATAINMFLEEGSTKILGPIYLEAINGRGFVWKGKKHVTASTAVTITTSSATAHSVEILGYIQAV